MSTRKKPLFGTTNTGIYNESVSQVKGKDLRDLNYFELRSIARTIIPIYGPKGLTKLIKQPSNNDFFITQKGYQIATTFKNQLPIVKMIKRLVESQQNNYGDGTKVVILILGLLVEKGIALIEQGINPQIINKGYHLALKKALETIEKNKIKIKDTNDEKLKSLIATNITNKFGTEVKQYIVQLIIQLVKEYSPISQNKKNNDFSNIFFRNAPGKSMLETELLNGFIIFKNRKNTLTPNKINSPKIILIQEEIDYFIAQNHKNLFYTDIEDPKKYNEFSLFQHNFYKNLAIYLKDIGINVLLCQRKANEEFISACTSLELIILDMVGEKEIQTLSKMFNIEITSCIKSKKDITNLNIGTADFVEFKEFSKEEMFFIQKQNSPIFTFLIRGGCKHVIGELRESLESAVQIALHSLGCKSILPGGGSIELEISKQIQDYALAFPDKNQLVISEYGKIFENLAGFLIMNSGEDPLKIVPHLKSFHFNNLNSRGFDCENNEIVDVIEQGILDECCVKSHAIIIATEMARQILRIDDLIMIYDRKLFEDLKSKGKEAKMEKRNRQILNHFKKHEKDITFNL